VYPPLGLLYLASFLTSRGFRVKVIDGTFQDFETILETLPSYSSSIIGVTANLITANRALQLVRYASDHGMSVIAGGPDPALRPDVYFEAGADAVFPGEGEEALLDYIRQKSQSSGTDPQSIPGVRLSAHRNTEPRPFIDDIDQLPFPDLTLIDIPAYLEFGRKYRNRSSLSILSARGCPFKCTWCAKPIFGNSYRMRSSDSFVEELESIVSTYKPDRIRILDDVFTLNRKRTVLIVQEIIRRKIPVEFECLARIDCLDEELLTLLKKAGCVRIWCGIESGSQFILDRMKKGVKVEQSRQVAHMIHDAGIELACYVMLGYPGERAEHVAETISLLDDIRPDRLSVSIAYPLPGTEFYDDVRDRIATAAPWSYTNEYPIAYKREYIDIYYKLARSLLYQHWRRRNSSARGRWLGKGLSFLAEKSLDTGFALVCRISRWKMPQETI
jgi:radical SAM superfamily enzyme YgiQ (UPF0313 family)